MAVDIHREIHQGLDEVTAGRREFIRKAFQILPKLDRPRILDIGCGRGGPTLELARQTERGRGYRSRHRRTGLGRACGPGCRGGLVRTHSSQELLDVGDGL